MILCHYTPNPEAQTLNLDTQHSTLNTQHSALNTQHSALNTQHLTLNTQHSTLNNQHSTLNTQFPHQVLQHDLADSGSLTLRLPGNTPTGHPSTPNPREREREFFIDDLLVRIHHIV